MHPTEWWRYRDLASFYEGAADMVRGVERDRRFNEALQYRQKELQLAPDNPGALQDMGMFYLHQQIPSKGIEYLQRSISIKPGWVSYTNLGQELYRQKRYTDAIELFRKAIELAPKNAYAWAGLADMYAEGFGPQRYDQLRDTYAHAIERAEEMMVTQRDERGLPVSFPKSYWRARIATWRVLTDKTRALTETGDALQLNPRWGLVLARAALVYEQSGMRDDALAFMKSAIGSGIPGFRHELESWPTLKWLVEDPRYKAFIESRLKE
jgi:tetratricopeptide (TPR) repeat protein